MAATALRLEMICGRCPRVARASQPWALGRNPVGIRHGSEQPQRGQAGAGRPGGRGPAASASSPFHSFRITRSSDCRVLPMLKTKSKRF